MAGYDFKEVEKKWSSKYEGFWGYKGVDFAQDKQKFYMLTEFPYPSGSGLHVGHAFSMTGADVYARYQRMLGKNVMFPMGWDAFGLPTENYAIKTGIKPQEATKQNTNKFKEQMKALGFSFDWDREINTTSPDYYKWTQWIFIKLFEKGLAYKQEMPINWCPKDKIGLANEEVVNGKCERCGTVVERRTQSQWVVKITQYADRLIEGLKNTDFIEKVKAAQINWIGKSEGAKIRFKLADGVSEVEVFTTRPDTLPGATFLVLAPEHTLVQGIYDKEVIDYVEKSRRKSEMERTELSKEKTGVFSGIYAINPFTKKQIPIWIADYVLTTYGSGAIMSVPSHDERDGEFAKKYG
ncbi:MAG TPA: class I tRNA ligase family protein, partial [Patescibacteria group bacterium]